MSQPSQALSVLTYNIHKGFGVGNRRFTLHQIKDALEDLDVDIIFLQEIQGEHTGKQDRHPEWPLENHAEVLAKGAWDHHAYGKNAIYKKGHHGNAILSKYPFIEWENINVANHSFASRSILHGVVDHPRIAKPLHVVCIHFGLFENERAQQIAALSERIEEVVPHDEPLIVAGDFNDWRRNVVKHIKEELELKEVFSELEGRHARTYPVWQPVFAMDRIYYRGLKAESCQRYHEKPWRQLSDHAPLGATFHAAS